MSELKELLTLDLSLNQLNGSIPRSVMDSMKNMQIIWNLSHNKLAGAIPQEIGGLVMVQEIDLSNNQFSGQIPESLKGCKNLYSLDLSSNQLSGDLPLSQHFPTT